MARRRYGGYWDDYPRYPKTTPKPVEGGIKARSKSGKFGETWWAARWIAALERLVDAARLGRGRSYARQGQVLNIDIEPGRVQARVQGSRATPYKIDIQVKPLTDAEWNRVSDTMAEQAIFAAKLLAGEMPQDIEEAFAAAKLSLFPGDSRDLVTSCSCPDWANPCKHIAAVYYLLGEEFDRDPFLIFRLRGRSRDEIMAALRARRAAAAPALPEAQEAVALAPTEAIPGKPLEEDLEHFWSLGESLDDFHVKVAPPAIEAALIKSMGPPPFWSGSQDFIATLSAVYAAVTLKAEEWAFGESGDNQTEKRAEQSAG